MQALFTLARLRAASESQLFGKNWDRAYHSERHQELSQAHPLMAMHGD
jgi:hypothetical protein